MNWSHVDTRDLPRDASNWKNGCPYHKMPHQDFRISSIFAGTSCASWFSLIQFLWSQTVNFLLLPSAYICFQNEFWLNIIWLMERNWFIWVRRGEYKQHSISQSLFHFLYQCQQDFGTVLRVTCVEVGWNQFHGKQGRIETNRCHHKQKLRKRKENVIVVNWHQIYPFPNSHLEVLRKHFDNRQDSKMQLLY